MNQKLKRIMVIIVVFTVVWGFLSWSFPKKKSMPQSPTPEISSEVRERTIDTGIRNSIKARLPVRNEDFSIVYFEESGQFGVTIFQGNFEEKKQLVDEWFKEQGVEKPEELSIIWSATNWVITE